MFKKKFLISSLIFVILLLLLPTFLGYSIADEEVDFKWTAKTNLLVKKIKKHADLYWYLMLLSKQDGSDISYESFKNSEFIRTVLDTPAEAVDGREKVGSHWDLDKFRFVDDYEDIVYGWKYMRRPGPMAGLNEDSMNSDWDTFNDSRNYRCICSAHGDPNGGANRFTGFINGYASSSRHNN